MATSNISSATSGSSGNLIDVASIVSQLMTVEQQPLVNLSVQQASYQTKLSALGNVKSALSTFQSAVSGLADPAQYVGLSASSSNPSAVIATTSNTASAGSYSINVSSLAQAQSLVATGQTSETTSIGSGATTTLTFDFGTITGGTLTSGTYTGATFTPNGSGSKTVTIDSSNNSLQGIADAINAANIGATATIINDGSTSPYRLVLTSSNGVQNSMKISVAGDATLSSLLAYDPSNSTGQNLNQTSAAQNANLTVNGIAVTKSTNTISDVIKGVTLDLQQTTTSPLTVAVTQSSSGISTAVNKFTTAYNALNTAIKNVASYDAATKTAGPLFGDFSIQLIQTQISSLLTTPVAGASGSLTSLAAIGVSFQTDGSMAADSTKLNAAISASSTGVASLLSSMGSTTDSLVSFDSAASTVQPGTYAVNVTQLATQGTLVGSAVVGTTTITAGVNDTLNVTVDGTSTTITLPPGVYTNSTLATQIQATINGASAISSAKASVAVTQSAGMFTITSGSYGSSSSVAITGGNGASNLFGATPVTTAGVDVAGTIGGQPATGAGQYLTGSTAGPWGLKILINGGGLGSRGTVSYSQGYASKVDQLITSMLANNGVIANKTNGINQSITDINNQKDALNVRLAALQQSYIQQFTNLDSMLSGMNSTQQYLTQQLANLPKA